MFVRGGFKPAYGAGEHGGCKFVLLTIMFWMSDMMKFPYQKPNRQVLILDPKTLVDFETKESEIRERCLGEPPPGPLAPPILNC